MPHSRSSLDGSSLGPGQTRPPRPQVEGEGRPSRSRRPAAVNESDNQFRTGNERLYEAYNDLHALAQDFQKPFDAPAILVVGHQTDGKSGKPGGSHRTLSL